ncbi:hypothetical protein JNB71_23760 [Rhizobium herbae]|uniref:Phage holin family protein n=1 Tax=Rhizobium herbae TaxID=508661 RepID=A0ABS7HGA8_9HYPH|nr:hypothetical protein [Rhizobium herbae]MBW9066324.1 hypothetical protein [Rhizobium herbae]
MREYILSLGAWGPLIAIAVLHVLMTVVCGIRGEKRPYKFSLKQGMAIATTISIFLIVGTFVNLWLGSALMIAVGALAVQNMDAVDKFFDS